MRRRTKALRTQAAGVSRDVTDKIAEQEHSTVPLVPAAAYQGKPLDLREIGRDYDVHFALTGSARRQWTGA